MGATLAIFDFPIDRNEGKTYAEYDIIDRKKENFVLFLPNKKDNIRLRYLAPYYWNQAQIVRNIAISLPLGYTLVVKDHPHSIGGLIDSDLIDVVREFDNCVYIDPELETMDVVKERCRHVLSF